MARNKFKPQIRYEWTSRNKMAQIANLWLSRLFKAIITMGKKKRRKKVHIVGDLTILTALRKGK